MMAYLSASEFFSAKHRLQNYGQQDFFRHAIPADSGGLGDTFAELVHAHAKVGRQTQDCGLILALNAHLWGAVFPLLRYGTEQQQTHYLKPLIRGELIGGHAITEPQAGSDLSALKTKAETTTAHSIFLNGHKRYITNAPIADLLIVYARENGQLNAYIVLADDKNVQFTDEPTVHGCQTATMGDIILDQTPLSQDRQLGKTGAGGILIQQALELERAFIFAGISGIMDWQLQTVIKYARERIVNQAPLGKNQAISHKIADMRTRLDSVKLWLNECAHLKDNQKRISLCSAQTKLVASEAFLQSSLDAVQILGGFGLSIEHPMANLVYDAMSSRLFSGSSEIQKNIIANLLGTGDGYHPNIKDQSSST
jgi:alkylation response protein AidB-like acyl-CoA dehydrogenase